MQICVLQYERVPQNGGTDKNKKNVICFQAYVRPYYWLFKQIQTPKLFLLYLLSEINTHFMLELPPRLNPY